MSSIFDISEITTSESAPPSVTLKSIAATKQQTKVLGETLIGKNFVERVHSEQHTTYVPALLGSKLTVHIYTRHSRGFAQHSVFCAASNFTDGDREIVDLVQRILKHE